MSGVREEAALEGKAAGGRGSSSSSGSGSGSGAREPSPASGAGAMPTTRVRSQSPVARGATGVKQPHTAKKRKDTGLQGEYWTNLSPRNTGLKR